MVFALTAQLDGHIWVQGLRGQTRASSQWKRAVSRNPFGMSFINPDP